MDRRDFLKLGAASAAGLVGPVVGAAEDKAPMQPAAAVTQPFTFAVVADPHCRESPKPGLEHMGTGLEKFVTCAERMAGLPEGQRPDFALVVGDIHPDALRGHLDRIAVPLHVVAGNHESGSAKKALRAMFPGDFKRGDDEADYYSFVHKGVRFIGVCNAGAGGDHIGHFCSEDIRPRGQCEWLEEQLAAPERRKIVFAHIPPEPDNADRNMYLARNDSAWFQALIGRTQPEALFFGHLHRATSERRIGRTRSFIVRSCCWNGDRSPVGFMLVRVTPEGLDVTEVETGRYA